MTTTNTPQDLIPHRFENLFIDSIQHISDNPVSGEAKVTVTSEDRLNRQAFYKKRSDSTYLIRALYMEFLALGSICCLPKKKDHTYIFAGISEVNIIENIPINETLYCKASKTKEKGPLVFCDGQLYNENKTLLGSCKLTAALVSDEQLTDHSLPKETKLPEENIAIKLSLPEGHKHPQMSLIDSLIYKNEDQRQFTFSYTYPQDHFCTRGHFPGNPIMMGVMQLSTIEDACWILSKQGVLKSPVKSISGDAVIKKNTGDVVASIKGFSVEINDESVDFTRINKIGFKAMVHPGETIYITLNNVTTT